MNLRLDLLLAVSNPSGSAAGFPGLTEALLLIAIGGLAVVAYLLRRLLTRLDVLEQRLTVARPRPEVVREAPPAPAPAPPPRADDSIPTEILAAVMAAVYAAAGSRARIVSIASGDEAKLVWSLEGRRQIFASHQVR